MKIALKKEFISDTLFSALNSVGVILKPFALVYLVNNYLGTESYGQIAVFLSSLSLVVIMSSLGVGFSMTRHILGEEDINAKKQYFYFPINFQLRLLFTYFLIAYCYVLFGKSSISITELSIYCFYYLSYILFQYFLEYRRWVLNAKGYAVVFLIYTIIFLSVLVSAFLFDLVQNIYQVLMAEAVIMFSIFLYLFSTLYKQLGLSFKTFTRKNSFEEMRLGMPFALGGLGEIMVSAADRFMIVYFFGLFEAGLYSTGYMLGSLSLIFVRLVGLFLPQHMFSDRDSGDHNAVNNLLNISFLAFFSLSIPYVFFLLLFGSNILSLVNINSDLALFSMILISIASIFFGSYLLLSSVTLMEKKTNTQMQIILTFALCNVLANYIFMLLFDSFVVASAVTLATYFLIITVFVRHLKTIWSFDFPVKFFLMPLVIATLSYGFIRLIELKLPSFSTDFFVLEVILFLSLYLIGLLGFLGHSKIIPVGNLLSSK